MGQGSIITAWGQSKITPCSSRQRRGVDSDSWVWGDEENYEVIIIQDGYSALHQGKVKMESSITFI